MPADKKIYISIGKNIIDDHKNFCDHDCIRHFDSNFRLVSDFDKQFPLPGE